MTIPFKPIAGRCSGSKDLLFRAAGAGFLGLAGYLFRLCARTTSLAAPHEAEPAELATALLVFLSLSLGLALLLEGSGILAAAPAPPRPWLH